VTIGAYALTRAVNPCEATWKRAQSSALWGQPGASDTQTDRRATAASTVTTAGINRAYSFDLTGLAQEWLAGALANSGVLLRADSSTASFQFASAEHNLVALRPELAITYLR